MSFLDDIVERRRRDVAERKKLVPLSVVREVVTGQRTGRDFAGAIRASQSKPAIVAEFKRCSPSAGAISLADVRDVAWAYEEGGAAALSVLTEPHCFAGELADIATARSACGLSILRKDFIVDEYQIYESVAAGADALLLIAAALPDSKLVELRALTERLGMQALVEVHDEAEAARAAAAGARIIGVNNRDLRTLTVDMRTAARVRPAIPAGCISVAESGYREPSELVRCAEAGYDAVLVGERLLRSQDCSGALRSLRGAAV